MIKKTSYSYSKVIDRDKCRLQDTLNDQPLGTTEKRIKGRQKHEQNKEKLLNDLENIFR